MVLSSCATLEYYDGYTWRKDRTAIPQSAWVYYYLERATELCEALGVKKPNKRATVLACAAVSHNSCIIILPRNPPKWVVKHEEKHCQGWEHN